MNEIDDLSIRLRDFAKARDWERFHTPKNLASALSVEASELLEIFQWMTREESSNASNAESTMADIKDECADVLIYLVRIADILGVDIIAEANAKIDRNEHRFPATPPKRI